MIKFYFKTFIFFAFLFICGNVLAATYYSRASANWGTASTWSTIACGGAAASTTPGATDNVIICAGHTVTMNDNGASCLSLTINGTATWSAARTTNVGAGGLIMDGGTMTWSGGGGANSGILTVSGNFTVSGGTSSIGRNTITVSGNTNINSQLNITNVNGTKTFTDLIISGTFNNSANSQITINGNLQNNGTYTVGTGQVTFGGASNNTITGTSTTAFNSLMINKGTSADNILDVQSLITLTAGGLTLTNGTLQLSNSSIAITPFTSDITGAPYLIPSTAGLWCDGAIINSGNMNWTVAGLLRVSAGTVNIGNSTDNLFRAENSGTTQLIVEGGTLNVAGAVSKQAAADFITFTVSGGTIVVPFAGITTAGVSPIQIDQASAIFNWSGGTIVIPTPGASNLGFTATAGTVNVSGGILQIGDASTPPSQTININSAYSIANLMVNSPDATAQLAANLTVLQSITVSSGILNANNLNITLGNSWENNGTFIPGTGTVILDGTGTQTITKSGGETFNNLTIGKPGGTTILANNLQVDNTFTMTSGNIDCGSNTLTLGISAVSEGTLSYTSGTIVGKFRRWKNAGAGSLSFPIGTSSFYRSALVTFTALPAGGTLTANFISADPGSSGLPYTDDDGITTIQNHYTEGYWDMTVADGLSTSAVYDIECTGNGFTSYSIGVSTRLLCRATSGSPWYPPLNGTHSPASGNTAKRAGVNGLPAQFAFGKPSCTAYSAVSITGNTTVCTNDAGVTYSVTETGGNTYTWVIIGGVVTSGWGTNFITVDWGAIGMTGNVEVTEQNTCSENNSPVNLSVTIHPIATSAITGAIDVSTNETGVAYSVTNTAGYSYNWTFPGGGGAVAGGQGFNSITVDWGPTAGIYSLRVDATQLCAGTDFQTLSVTVRAPFYSRASGNWDNANTWSNVACSGAAASTAPGVNDEVIICSGHTITMRGNPGTCRKLTINGTAHWTQARTTNVGTGGITINAGGSGVTGTAAGVLTSTGGLTLNSNTNINSSVTIRLQTNTQNISSNASPGSLNRLDITTTATNTGKLTIANGGILSGSGTLVVGSGSEFTMNGTTFSINNFDASAPGNTVTYGASADQTIRASTYDKLVFSGTGTKILGGATVVNSDLTISVVTLDASASNLSLDVSGNWTNTGNFNPRFATVTFSGASTQTITKSGGETFNNLVMTGGGTKIAANDITINFDLTIASTFDIGNNGLTIRGNFDNSGTYTALSGNTVTFSNATTVSGTSTTQFSNVTITGVLTGHSNNMLVSEAWTNNGTFNHNNGTITFNGSTTIGGSATSNFGSVTITGTLNAPAGNMGIAGNFSNSGAFNHNGGTLNFNGTSAQNISGNNTFSNLTIDNSTGGVAVASGAQNLINTLTLTNGNFNTNNNFTLVSDASATARIAAITGGSITGDATMQRYIPAGNSSWRQLGTAVSGQTLNDWKDDFAMCGFTGASSCGGTGISYSVYTYDESVAGDQDNGFVPATNITNSIPVGKGFFCFVGDGPVTTNPINLDVKGAVTTGDISLPVTFTSTAGGPAHDGWNLVTNPYPSNVDWDDGNWIKTNISANIAIWNPDLQNYAQYFGGTDFGTNGGTRYINSSQAFWVQADGGGVPTLTIKEPVKVANVTPFFKQSGDPDVLKLRIKSSGLTDETFIQFKDSANIQFGNSDAYKFFSDYNIPHIVSVINDSINASLNTVPALTSDMVFPVHAGGKATQSIGGGKYVCNKTFTISANNLNAISMSACIILEDTKTGTMTNLRDTSYTFTVTDTATSYLAFVPALDASPRFLIHVGSAIEKNSTGATCYGFSNGMAIAQGKGNGQWSYVWRDENGSVVKTTSPKNEADTLKNISAGVYSVEVSGNNGLCSTLKDTVVINEPEQSIFVISDIAGTSCFGESDGEAQIFVSGNFPPFSYLWNNAAETQSIGSLSAGNYTLTVTDSTGCSVTQNIYIFQPELVAASFTVSDTIYLSDGGMAQFINTSTGSDEYIWDFGDGSLPDSSYNPTHQFSETGVFTVSLSASDENCGNDFTTMQITILETNPSGIINYSESAPEIKVLNSGNGIFITVNFRKPVSATVNLYNVLGQNVYSSQISGQKTQLFFNPPSGIYFLQISERENSYRYKIEAVGR